jgi:hypothetical protein
VHANCVINKGRQDDSSQFRKIEEWKTKSQPAKVGCGCCQTRLWYHHQKVTRMNGTMDDTAGTETQTTRDPNAICTLLGHESNRTRSSSSKHENQIHQFNKSKCPILLGPIIIKGTVGSDEGVLPQSSGV